MYAASVWSTLYWNNHVPVQTHIYMYKIQMYICSHLNNFCVGFHLNSDITSSENSDPLGCIRYLPYEPL